MRLGYQTEDNNKKIITRKRKKMQLGFPTTPTSRPKPKAKRKRAKIIIHSKRLGFPTTPHKPKTTQPVVKPKPKSKFKFPIIHRKRFVKSKDLVSILVLNYNTLEVLKPCVRSILLNTVHPYELIVVDNGSKDGSVEWAKKAKRIHVVIENGRNLGFSKANNFGMKVAKGSYILLLNSDTIVRTRGWLRKMVACASDPSVGTVGAKLLYEKGKIQHIGGGIHPKTFDPYHPYDHSLANIPQAKVNHVVPFCTGACLLIKRSTVRKVGYLDEAFGFGFEDVDYGLRVVEAGLKNVVCCNAVLTHLWAYTQRKFKGTARLVSKNVNRYRLKWFPKFKSLSKVKKESFWGWGPYVSPFPLKAIPLTVPKA